MIHLYGVVEELRELPEVEGVRHGALERQLVGELELVLSRHAEPVAGEISQEDVVRHAEVVEELMTRSRAVLPVRFGSEFADEVQLEGAVQTRAAELARGLSRVRGCVEFGLRALRDGHAADPPPAASGSDYMQARLDEVRRRDELVRELHEPLARLSRANARYAATGRSLLESAYLVPEADVAGFCEQVVRLEAAHSEVSVVCTGPWPPYSFATEPEDA